MVKNLDKLTDVKPESFDSKAPAEEDQYRKEYLRTQLEKVKEDLRQKSQDREERKRYAHNIFTLICCWLSIVLVMTIVNGLGLTKISDKVIITLITTTTANVLGLMIIVMKYLFNTGKPAKTIKPAT